MHKYTKLREKLAKRRQEKFLRFISNMTPWEYEVFDAFRARLRVDELTEGSQTKEAYNLFLKNRDDPVAQILVSIEMHKWRPTGIAFFAKLVEIHQTRDDDAVIEAIDKASTISTAKFKKEYPDFESKGKVTPKMILETILLDDHRITVPTKAIDTTSTYDGLREDDS